MWTVPYDYNDYDKVLSGIPGPYLLYKHWNCFFLSHISFLTKLWGFVCNEWEPLYQFSLAVDEHCSFFSYFTQPCSKFHLPCPLGQTGTFLILMVPGSSRQMNQERHLCLTKERQEPASDTPSGKGSLTISRNWGCMSDSVKGSWRINNRRSSTKCWQYTHILMEPTRRNFIARALSRMG